MMCLLSVILYVSVAGFIQVLTKSMMDISYVDGSYFNQVMFILF